MDTTKKTTVPKTEFPPQSEKLSFNDTQVAFASKSDNDLKKAYVLFKLVASKGLMVMGKFASLWAMKLQLPVKGIIKKTIFHQFCGGETIEECAGTTKILDIYNIGTILDYSVEGKETEEEFESGFQEILRTVETAHDNPHIPFCVFKVSGLCRNKLLEKVSARKQLSEKETEAFTKLKSRVDALCKRAAEANTPVFMDAEESWIQQAIDDLAMEMMGRYNKERAIVYNTLQMYRHDRLAHLAEAQKSAEREGFYYGVKLVRGAYMEKERDRAEDKGYASPIQPNKASTDSDFNAAVDFCLMHLTNVYFCSGTHNEESSLMLANKMNELGIDHQDERIFFAQLFGMSDHISFNLSKASFNVAKYVPYGPVKEVMPYLIRRAEENTSVQGQTSRELNLIKKEIRRRRKG